MSESEHFGTRLGGAPGRSTAFAGLCSAATRSSTSRPGRKSRVERLAQHLAKTFYGQPTPLGVWSVVDGLVVDGTPVPDTRDPLRVLEAILAADGKGFYVLKDFLSSGDGRAEIVRRLRDVYRALKDRGRHVLLVSPRLQLPEEAKKEIYVVEYELPDDAEIVRLIDANARKRFGAADRRVRRSSGSRWRCAA